MNASNEMTAREIDKAGVNFFYSNDFISTKDGATRKITGISGGRFHIKVTKYGKITHETSDDMSEVFTVIKIR